MWNKMFMDSQMRRDIVDLLGGAAVIYLGDGNPPNEIPNPDFALPGNPCKAVWDKLYPAISVDTVNILADLHLLVCQGFIENMEVKEDTELHRRLIVTFDFTEEGRRVANENWYSKGESR